MTTSAPTLHTHREKILVDRLKSVALKLGKLKGEEGGKLYQAILRHWPNGIDCIAREFVQAYINAPPGSPVKSQIMRMISGLAVNHNMLMAKGLAGEGEPEPDMEDMLAILNHKVLHDPQLKWSNAPTALPSPTGTDDEEASVAHHPEG